MRWLDCLKKLSVSYAPILLDTIGFFYYIFKTHNNLSCFKSLRNFLQRILLKIISWT